MSDVEVIEKALNERDEAITKNLDGTKKRLDEIDDRVAGLEQRGIDAVDIGPVYSDHMGRKHHHDPMRVLKALASPKAVLDGFEAEWSQEAKSKMPAGARGEYFVPIQTKNFDSGGSSPTEGGASWIQTTVHSDVIPPLYQQSTYLALNPTRIKGHGGPVDLPRISTDLTGYVVDGDGQNLTESDFGVDVVSLTPNYYGGIKTANMKTIEQGSPDVARTLFEAITRQIGVKIDLDAFTGDGTAKATGLQTVAGNSVASSSPLGVTYQQLVEMERTLIDDKVQGDGWVYVASPAAYEAMKTTTKTSGDTASNFIAQSDGRGGWTANGFPLYCTTHLTGYEVLLYRVKSAVYGDWGALGLAADPYGSNFASGSVTFRGFLPFDSNVTHADAVCTLN